MGGAAACCAPAAAPWTRRGTRVRRSRVSAVMSDAESFRRIVRHPETAKASDGTLLYFGFGANIAASALRLRGVIPSASVVAHARDWRLVFIHRGGYATLDESREGDDGNDAVVGCWGSVHRISQTELSVIRRWEIGYEMKEIDVHVPTPTGDESSAPVKVRAVVFLTKPSARLKRPVPTFEAYAAKLLRGAREVGLPAEHVDRLQKEFEASVPKEKRGPEYFDVQSSFGRFFP